MIDNNLSKIIYSIIIIIFIVQCGGNSERLSKCGVDISTKRSFSSGAGAIHDLVKTRVVTLYSTQQSLPNEGIIISIDRYGGAIQDETHNTYISYDLGESWVRVAKDYLDRPHISFASLKSVFVSNSDQNTLYRPVYGVRGVYISVSHNGGKSWENVHSTIGGTIQINDFKIVETSFRDKNRLYGIISHINNPGLYVSDDCGKTLRLLAKNVHIVKESKHDSIIYGVGGSPIITASMGLMKSLDFGKSWEMLNNAEHLFRPLYRNNAKGQIYSYRRNPDDEEIAFSYPIDQIEIDPNNSDIFYLKGYKGLYRSIDGGKSFTLLPLAQNLLYGIDKICVDSHDGRYIYASVNMNSIYRSDNYGCSWNKLALPE